MDEETKQLLRAMLSLQVDTLTELRHIYAIVAQHGKGTIVNDLRKQTLDNLSRRSAEVSQALLPKRF